MESALYKSRVEKEQKIRVHYYYIYCMLSLEKKKEKKYKTVTLNLSIYGDMVLRFSNCNFVVQLLVQNRAF